MYFDWFYLFIAVKAIVFKCVGPKMVLHHHTTDGTALHPASFRLRYEFVDTYLGGEQWAGAAAPGSGLLQEASPPTTPPPNTPPPPCARIFRKVKESELNSPRYAIFIFI